MQLCVQAMFFVTLEAKIHESSVLDGAIPAPGQFGGSKVLKFSCSVRDRFQRKNTLITSAVGSLKYA